MTPPLITVPHARSADWETGGRLEWLVTNGRGGFAMAAVNQMLTRRYHGLLVAAIDPPVERYLLLAKLDVTATVAGRHYDLATNSYVGAVHPHGYRQLESFSLCPVPTWRWRAGDATIEQTLCLTPGEDTVYVRYRLLDGASPVTLTVRPLGTSRHFHILSASHQIGMPAMHDHGDRIVFEWPDGRPRWQLSHNGRFQPHPDWYYQFFLRVEAERGYDFKQDLWTPGTITATLDAADPAGLVIAASTGDRSWADWPAAFDQAGRETPPPPTLPDDPLAAALHRATDDFLVSRGDGLKTVIAGYPWFGDWGRDTFISLPGLCLVTGRFEDARKIIEVFARYVDRGMIPNRFPDFGDAPEYNTVDATLWYIHALDRYLAYTGNWPFVAERMFPVVAEILAAHETGTRHGIHLAEDGLLAAGEPGVALTWMDAQVAGRSITPRMGKPVEINALWYNALRIAAAFAQRLGHSERHAHWQELADRCRAAFNERFWNPVYECLHDVVDARGPDAHQASAVRPNQLLAISLTHPVLDPARWRSVVAVVERELWTPLGLRTLWRADAEYRGRYGGDLPTRDAAYHQGTVWPWLLGPLVTARVKAHGGTAEARGAARRLLDGLAAHLEDAGLGSVSEVADGDPPHRPEGCPWQAWSVAEPLRALCEDIHGRGA